MYYSKFNIIDDYLKILWFFFISSFIQIRVNTVNPTAVRTQMAMKEGIFDENNPFANAMKTRTPLGRFAGNINCYFLNKINLTSILPHYKINVVLGKICYAKLIRR